jgi:uncharacterized protein (DUF885 family)
VTSPQRYRETVDTILDDVLSLYPEQATALGDHRHDHALNDLSDDGLARRRTRLTEDRDALDALDLDELDPEDAVDAQLVRTGIDGLLFALDGTADHTWNPLVWLPGEALFPLVEREGTPVADRLRSLASRLDQVPDRLAQARKTVERPPRVHVETAVDQTAGAAALLGDQLEALLEQEPGLRSVVEPARDAALKALADHREALAASVETADGDPRLGERLFAAKLHLTLDSDLSAAEVTRRAEENLALVEEQLREISGGDVRSALMACTADVPNDDDVLVRAQEAFARAREHVLAHDIVTLHDDPYEWVVMPEFRRGVAIAYCDSPGPLEPPGLKTQLAVAPTPADWSPERVASFYREYNLAMLADLVVHEAMPGHLVQLDHDRRFHGSTRARQIFDSGPFIEGWAVHAERLMAETGCGGPRVRLQQLKMQLRMSINALLDAGVHAGDMTEAEAMGLMMGRGFQEEGEAVGKWRRALLTSTQLSTYFVGYIELDDLFSRLRLDASSRYDDVLAHGSPPVRHLATLLGA